MSRTAQSIVEVFGDKRSGNCWKVRWTLEIVGRDYRWHETDVVNGASRTAEFLAMNPIGRVPLLRLADGRYLAESNAICWFLAEGSGLLPTDQFARAEVMQWQCFEQYNHEPYIAVARFIRKFLPSPNAREQERLAKQPGGRAALQLMDDHLQKRDWLVGDDLSLADICLYAYTHVAEEGGFSLAPYQAVNAWLARCAPRLPTLTD